MSNLFEIFKLLFKIKKYYFFQNLIFIKFEEFQPELLKKYIAHIIYLLIYFILHIVEKSYLLIYNFITLNNYNRFHIYK